MTLHHVLFDLDGTLIDSAPAILSSFEETLGLHGIVPRMPCTRALIGPPLRQVLADLSGQSDPGRIDELTRTFTRSYFERGIPMTAPFPGVDELLARLSGSGLTLHLTTNKRRAPTEALITRLGWGRHFATVYAPEGTETPPLLKPELLRRQLSATSIRADEAIYVGDTREDGHAAHANDLVFIAVAWGYGAIAESESHDQGWHFAPDVDALGTLLVPRQRAHARG